MVRFKIALTCLGVALAPLQMEYGTAKAAGSHDSIDVLDPVEGAPWSGDRMRGARERLKDVLPGKRS